MGLTHFLKTLLLTALLCLAAPALAADVPATVPAAAAALGDAPCVGDSHHGDDCGGEMCVALDCCSLCHAGLAQLRAGAPLAVAPRARLESFASPPLAHLAPTPPFRPPIA